MPPLASPEAFAILDAATGVVLDRRNENAAAPPGSTVKPFLPASGVFPCRRNLTIEGHRLDCTHPPVYGPVGATDALALSCNCYFAALALRQPPETIRRALIEFDAQLATTDAQRQLQALGHWGVNTTALRLARAYRRLLVSGPPAGITGKTGTTREGAWYAGWFPKDGSPRVVIAVLTGGRGAVDAEPAAHAIFKEWSRSH